MLGGLHTEMAIWSVVGDWVKESGWADMVAEANVATPGSAQGFESASHVTKTRYAHQVVAATLFHLRRVAYDGYVQNYETDVSDGDLMSFETWKEHMNAQFPNFKYWNITLELELKALCFVRAIREGNFFLYHASIRALLPWFLALDHVHYARWLSVHLRDMSSLVANHPLIYKEFIEGHFVAHKSRRVFSGLATDQVHEQNNAKVKGEGGAVGLLDSPNALRRFFFFFFFFYIGFCLINIQSNTDQRKTSNTMNYELVCLIHHYQTSILHFLIKQISICS